MTRFIRYSLFRAGAVRRADGCAHGRAECEARAFPPRWLPPRQIASCRRRTTTWRRADVRRREIRVLDVGHSTLARVQRSITSMRRHPANGGSSRPDQEDEDGASITQRWRQLTLSCGRRRRAALPITTIRFFDNHTKIRFSVTPPRDARVETRTGEEIPA